MSFSRPIKLKGQALGGGKEPLVCMPLVGCDEETIFREMALVRSRVPDLIEWRVDFFVGIGDVQRVVTLVQRIRALAGGIPLIFTRRSIREGGAPIALDEDQVFAVYAAVCRSGCVDLFDYELSSEPHLFAQAVALAEQTGVPLIASYHNFQETPSAQDIVAKLVAMERAGADIAKVAVMPTSLRDVLTLLEATQDGMQAISLPIISMSMGGYGSLSRLFGWAFGSSVTFVVGENSSAPGQVPIEDLKVVVDILHRSLRDK